MLPLSVLYVLADIVGEIWYLASPRLRAVLAHNLALVPGLAGGDGAGGNAPGRARPIGNLARRISRNFGRVVAEFLYSPRITPGNVGDLVDMASFEVLRKYAEPPGAVFATAHLGNWELGGTVLAMLGINLAVIVYDDPDSRIARLFRGIRRGRGMGMLPVGTAPRDLVSAVREASLGVVADRDFSGRGMVTRFFGKRVRMPVAYAGLAAARGVPVILGVCVKTEDGRYRLVAGEPMHASRNDPESARGVAAECIRRIEKYVEEYPEQWYLFEKVGGGEERDE